MNGLTKNKLAMVDMDGTLVCTLDANYMAYKQALAEAGFSLTRAYFASHCDGRSYRDFLPEIMGSEHPLMERVHQRKSSLYGDCLAQVRLNTHLMNMLQAMQPTYYLALVTTASRANVEKVLARFQLTSFFDLVLTQEDVDKHKPSPECYFQALAHFPGVPKENAIIFEDSEVGVQAAINSGCAYFRFGGWSEAKE